MAGLWHTAARYGAFAAPILLIAAPMALVPMISFASAGLILVFQFFAFEPEASSKASWQAKMPHLLVCIGVWTATARRGHAVWFREDRGDVPFIPRVVTVVIPSVQALNLSACLLCMAANILGSWGASRGMLLGSGIIGLAGNLALRFVFESPPSLGFTPAGCSFSTSIILWSSFCAAGSVTNERRRRVIRFLLTSTPLRLILKTRLTKSNRKEARASGSIGSDSSVLTSSVLTEASSVGTSGTTVVQGTWMQEMNTKLVKFGDAYLDEVEDLETIDWLGQGSFGSVKLCRSPSSGDVLVVKQVILQNMDQRKDKDETVREVRNCAMLRHPHIVRLYSAFVSQHNYRPQLNILQEYAAGGTLSSRIRKAASVSVSMRSSVVSAWIGQLATAVQFMHSKSVLHRDLTSNNVFIKEDNELLVGDLGLSCKVSWGSRSSKDTELLAQSCVGTPIYMSPELVRSDPYGTPSDVWAIGVIVFELLALAMPFQGTNLWNHLLLIMNGTFNKDALAALKTSDHPPEMQALPTSQFLLHPDASKRMRLDELLEVCPYPTDNTWKSLPWYRARLASAPKQQPPEGKGSHSMDAMRVGFSMADTKATSLPAGAGFSDTQIQ